MFRRAGQKAAAAREAEQRRRQTEWNALHFEILRRLVTDIARVEIDNQHLAHQGRVTVCEGRFQRTSCARARTDPTSITAERPSTRCPSRDARPDPSAARRGGALYRARLVGRPPLRGTGGEDGDAVDVGLDNPATSVACRRPGWQVRRLLTKAPRETSSATTTRRLRIAQMIGGMTSTMADQPTAVDFEPSPPRSV